MEKNKIEELRTRILKGIDLAIQRLIIKKSKDDKELVFSKEGKIIRIKAKELERQMHLPQKAKIKQG